MSSMIYGNYQLHSSGGSRARAAAAKSGSADAFLKTILQTAKGKECAAQLANRGDHNAALSAISIDRKSVV